MPFLPRVALSKDPPIINIKHVYFSRGVNIAERSVEGVHEISNRLWSFGGQFSQGDGVVQLEFGADRVVEHGTGAGHGVLALREVPVLPLGPDPIELGVMHVEDGIAGAGECVPHFSADALYEERKLSTRGKGRKRKAIQNSPKWPPACRFWMAGLAPTSMFWVKTVMLTLSS